MMDWRERFVDVAITLVLTILTSGVLLRLLRPALFDFIVFACKMRKEEFKAFVENLFVKEIAERKAAIEMVNSHKDILEFIVTSIKRTNEEMPEMTKVLNRVADSVDSLNHTCERLNEGQAQTQVALGRLDERTKLWERLHALDIERLAGREPKRISDHIMGSPQGG